MDLFAKLRITIQDYGMEYFKRYYAPIRGTVFSNEDPEVLGRLRLKVPVMYGSRIQQYWAWPIGMYAGKNIGFFALPNPGDVVWVHFENGDPRYPIWQYGHWTTNHKPPDTVKSSKQKVFQTTSGMRLVYDDDKKNIVIFRSKGRAIEINDKTISLGSEAVSKYSGVLGEVLEEVLQDIRLQFGNDVDELIAYCNTQLAATQSIGILAPLSAGYTVLLAKLMEIQAMIIKIEKKIPDIKSKIITLD